MTTRKLRLQVLLIIISLLIASLPVQPAAGAAQAGFELAPAFRDYYARNQGMRVLGMPVSGQTELGGIPVQYFEKGRLEDHRATVRDPQWSFMFGRLTAELMERDPRGSVSGTTLTYGDLRQAAEPQRRVAPAPGFSGGTAAVQGGRFVPFSSSLQRATGYVVPQYFWSYISDPAAFPAGWLHDVGLPVTAVFEAAVTKNGERRTISIQAFERAVLSYDPKNPPAWRVERANIGSDAVRTLPAPPANRIELPAEGARVLLPLHILARVERPGQQVVATLRWRDGNQLSQTFTTLRGEDGRGVLVDTLDWQQEGIPPLPPTQPATLEIRNSSGTLLAQRQLTVLRYDDPDVQVVSLYWIIGFDGEVFNVQQRRIPRTQSVGTAALEELLWGPTPGNLAGFITALPTPEEVLNYPGREADWGPRVRLKGLTITNGVATADFSKELRAYGGGSARVLLIREQITRTLRQFPSVQEVRIAIEGQTEGVLEP